MNLAEKTTAIVGVLIAVIGVLIAVAGFLTNYCQFAAVVGGAVVGVLTAAVVSILRNHSHINIISTMVGVLTNH